MYANKNFKTKKAFKEAVAAGEQITLYSPGMGQPKTDGIEYVEGPWAFKKIERVGKLLC